MFDMAMSQTDSSKDDMEKLKYKYTTLKEYSDQELLSMEKEMLGIYVSGHPLEKYRELIEKFADVNTLQMRDASELVSTENEEDVSPEKLAGRVQQLKDGQFVKYAGIITGIKKKYTKKQINGICHNRRFVWKCRSNRIRKLLQSMFKRIDR